jgi:GNAT superfamily N-acetyltransferase
MTPAEEAAVSDIMVQSFAVPSGDVRTWLEKAGWDQVRVVRGAKGPAAACLLIPMGQWVGGRAVPTVGIAGVGSRPDQRGQGSAKALMQAVLNEARGQGVALSTLYPATDSVYRRVGYERAGTRWTCVLLKELPVLPLQDVAGTLADADEPAAEAAYASGRACYSGGPTCGAAPAVNGAHPRPLMSSADPLASKGWCGFS